VCVVLHDTADDGGSHRVVGLFLWCQGQRVGFEDGEVRSESRSDSAFDVLISDGGGGVRGVALVGHERCESLFRLDRFDRGTRHGST
jgi:hypothetical protein